MKKKSNLRYSGISSFRDLQIEMERLSLKEKLAEAKIKMDTYSIRQAISLSSIVPSLLRDFGLAGLSETVENFIFNKNSDK